MREQRGGNIIPNPSARQPNISKGLASYMGQSEMPASTNLTFKPIALSPAHDHYCGAEYTHLSPIFPFFSFFLIQFSQLKIKTGDLQDSDMQKMIALIDTSLQFCPSQRPTAAQLMQHEVFDFNSGIAPEGCETFTDEEATEMQGYTDEKGKQLLRRLTEQPLQVEYSSDEESNSDQDSERGGEGGGMIGFLRLLISGENPSTHMWDASAECQQEHFDAACRECGIVQSHAAIQALTPEQLSMLGKNLGQRLQACALAFLNNQPIVAHNTVPITPDNVMQLRPQLYAYLNTLPEASEEQEMIVGAVRVNLEFLAEYDSILSIGGSAVAGDTDWSFAQDHVEETTGELEVDAADETWCLAGTRGQQ